MNETYTRDFKTDLEWSESQHTADWWTPFYKKAFPRIIGVAPVRDLEAQRAGVDKYVILDGGKRLAVDEKSRRNRKPGDVALEFKHEFHDGRVTPGWIEKPSMHTDYLAYGYVSYRTCLIIPFILLQDAWRDHKSEWLSRYGSKPSRNRDYDTYCCFVPTSTIITVVAAGLEINL